MGTGNYEFEQILKLLPEGWEAKAKELGALHGLVSCKALKNCCA
jgi:hypothetical protein